MIVRIAWPSGFVCTCRAEEKEEKNEEIERVEQKQSKREKWNRKIWKEKMGCQRHTVPMKMVPLILMD